MGHGNPSHVVHVLPPEIQEPARQLLEGAGGVALREVLRQVPMRDSTLELLPTLLALAFPGALCGRPAPPPRPAGHPPRKAGLTERHKRATAFCPGAIRGRPCVPRRRSWRTRFEPCLQET